MKYTAGQDHIDPSIRYGTKMIEAYSDHLLIILYGSKKFKVRHFNLIELKVDFVHQSVVVFDKR